MARTHPAITMELVHGVHTGDLWPRPGRILIAARTATFEQFGTAIDDAFARWDHNHLHEFTVADGTVIVFRTLIFVLLRCVTPPRAPSLRRGERARRSRSRRFTDGWHMRCGLRCAAGFEVRHAFATLTTARASGRRSPGWTAATLGRTDPLTVSLSDVNDPSRKGGYRSWTR